MSCQGGADFAIEIFAKVLECIVQPTTAFSTFGYYAFKTLDLFLLGCQWQYLLMQVLFASCHDEDTIAEIESLSGAPVCLSSTAAGDISWDKASDTDLEPRNDSKGQSLQKLAVKVPEWCGKWAVTMDDFADTVVGAKSRNLAGALHPVPYSESGSYAVQRCK